MRSITQTISKLYPNSVLSRADGDVYRAWSEVDSTTGEPKADKEITVDKAAVDAEYAKQDYVEKREIAYPTIEEQMDMQYWDSVNGTTTWKDTIAKIKTDFPKPS